MLTSSDFWPPVVGGWRSLKGYLVPMEVIFTALEDQHPKLRQDPDFLSNEDEWDWLSFLEDRADSLPVPPPAEVLVLGFSGSKTQPKIDLPPGYYAIWSSEVFDASPALRELSGLDRDEPPLTFRVWEKRRIPDGFGLILWLIAFVGIYVAQKFW